MPGNKSSRFTPLPPQKRKNRHSFQENSQNGSKLKLRLIPVEAETFLSFEPLGILRSFRGSLRPEGPTGGFGFIVNFAGGVDDRLFAEGLCLNWDIFGGDKLLLIAPDSRPIASSGVIYCTFGGGFFIISLIPEPLGCLLEAATSEQISHC